MGTSDEPDADFDRARVYADIFDQLGDALVVTRLDGTIIDWNAGAERLFGYERREVLGLTPAFLAGPERPEFVAGVLGDVMTQGEWQQDYEYVRKDGSRVQVETSVVLVTDAGGKPYLTIGVNRDIAERVAAESARRFAAGLLDQMSDAVHVLRRSDGCFVYVNKAFERMFGYPADAVMGRHVSLINADVEVDPQELAQRIIGELQKHGRWRGEVQNRRQDGSTFWCRAQVTSIFHYEHGEAWLSIHEDITALREAEARRAALEQQLQRSHRLEALGTLASGVAHDFNNILQGLSLTLEALSEALPASSALRWDVERGMRYAERGREVVGRILDYARSERPAAGPVDLNTVVARTMMLVQPLLASTIEFEMRLAPQPVSCRGDVGQIEQVIVNLCSNAGFAMRRSGGTLTVEVAPDRVAPEQFVRLVVSDTGDGIAKAIQERIFNPFFTTKAPGEGTGLGLSIVHNIVRAHGGSITVESEPGRGARFEVRLPRVEIEARVEEAAGRAPRVMIVDDEVALLDTYRRVLERRGMGVTAFADPQAALAALAAAPGSMDVVVTDQTMPGMTGLQLGQAIARLRPDLPVVLISGQITAADVGSEAASIRAFLAKPFRVGALVETLQAVLAGKGREG